MSYASSFDQQVQSYADQLENYNEQINNYKDSLIELRDQGKESTDALVEGVVSPLATELLRVGATRLFGAEAGEAVASLAKGGIGTLAKGGSVKDVFNSVKESMSGESGDGMSALDSAKQGVSNIMQKIRTGDVDGAEQAVSSAQSQLDGALNSLTSNVVSKLDTGVVSTLRNQIARITGSQTQEATSPLAQADKAMEADTKVFGDVELSDFASGPAKLVSPDLSLPFEATFQAPLAEPGATSNLIAQAITGKMQQISPEIPDSVIPSQEEALSMLTSQVRPMISTDLLPQGAGQVLEGAGQQVSGLVEQAQGLATSVASQATKVVSGLAEDAGSLAGQAEGVVSGALGQAGNVVSKLAGFAPEAEAEVEAGAAAGPEGLVLGGLVALGTLLAGMFGHKENQHLVPPPQLPQMSMPQFVPGLATGN